MTAPVTAAVHTSGRLAQVGLSILAVAIAVAVVASAGNPSPLTPVSGLLAALVTQGFVGVVEILIVRPTAK